MSFAYTLNANSTLATVSHSFRTVDGKKRDSIEFTFTPVTDYDSKVNAILNESLAQYGKLLIAQNADNWDYIPSDSELTISELYSAQSAPSARGNRLINKTSLAEIAQAYIQWAISIGKSTNQAQTGATVLAAQFKSILGNDKAISAMINNMNQFGNYISTNEDILSDSSTAALIRLIENLQELSQAQVSADSL